MNTEIDFNSDWRKTAIGIYRKPVDSKILGSVELDVTEVEQYIAEKRKHGVKVTLTHFFTLAIARGLREAAPELNCYVRRGKIIPRKSVDISISVLIGGETQMGMVKVENADQMTLDEIEPYLREKIAQARHGAEEKNMQSKSLLSRLPWPFRIWLVKLVKMVVIDWGFPVKGGILDPNSMGSLIFSNIGTIGLDTGYPALMPFSTVAMVVTCGAAESRPRVMDNQVVPRRMMTFGVAIDHRIADAIHGGRMFKYVKGICHHPAVLDQKPTYT